MSSFHMHLDEFWVKSFCTIQEITQKISFFTCITCHQDNTPKGSVWNKWFSHCGSCLLPLSLAQRLKTDKHTSMIQHLNDKKRIQCQPCRFVQQSKPQVPSIWCFHVSKNTQQCSFGWGSTVKTHTFTSTLPSKVPACLSHRTLLQTRR